MKYTWLHSASGNPQTFHLIGTNTREILQAVQRDDEAPGSSLGLIGMEETARVSSIFIPLW